MTIGKSVNNTKLYLLDEQENLAPYGTIAQLYVSGIGLAKGYIDTELNLERFISNPFGCKPKELLYKTEDLVRYLADGSLEYIGRTDEQVSINGFRVELGEIEQQITDYKKVNSCLVSYRDCEFGFKRLVAYIVLKERDLSDSELNCPNDELTLELNDHLAKILPSYMIPSVFMVIEQFPLTANGKVDKKKLPLPERLSVDLGRIAPSNEVEQRLVELMSKLLNTQEDSISVNDSFFELGLSSLKLFSCVNFINKELSLTLTIADIYRNNTVQLLAGNIKELNLVSQLSTNEQEEMSFYEDGEI